MAGQKTVSPGKGSTLLDQFLSHMPMSTQTQQRARFASVAASFEFGLFVPMQSANRLAGEAMQRGFTVWGNIDSTSAFLYGAGLVGQEEFTGVVGWLRGAAVPGQKAMLAIHNPGEPMMVVVLDV